MAFLSRTADEIAQEPDLPRPVALTHVSHDIGIQSLQTLGVNPQAGEEVFPHLRLTADPGPTVVVDLVAQGLFRGRYQERPTVDLCLIDADLISFYGRRAIQEQPHGRSEASISTDR